MFTAIMILLFLVIGSLAGIYFSFISPAFKKKPNIERPAQIGVDEHAISYIANEIDAYKLQKDPTTGSVPEIEFHVTDTGRTYSLRVIDGIPTTDEVDAIAPDLRISADSSVMIELLGSEDMSGSLVDLARQGKIGLEVMASEKTLALKGYKAIYDALSSGNNITGSPILMLNPVAYSGYARLTIIVALFLVIEFGLVKGMKKR